jgi:hypothetical protein
MNINEIQKQISDSVQNYELSNDDLVQIIEICGAYLNLQTIPKYAKEHNLSYNGAKKCREVKEILGVKFVIDNY